MQLFVIRHAVAEDVQPGTDGAERELTDAGRAKLRRAVRGLRALDIRFDRIVTSPWKRAMQTAHQLERIADAAVVTSELLTQSPRPELLALLAERNDTAAVVGHEPWLGELAAWLLFGDMRLGETLVIKKCGILWLEGTAVPRGMRLCAALPPRVLRAVG